MRIKNVHKKEVLWHPSSKQLEIGTYVWFEVLIEIRVLNEMILSVVHPCTKL